MIYELSNPLTKTLVTHLRDYSSDALRFRHTVEEITKQLMYEALKNSELVQKSITTWRGKESFNVIDEDNIVVATVLRAGMPMLDSAVDLLVGASAGFLGMKRDEVTHKSVLYYDRLPDCKGKTVILVDPMVATGGSMVDAIELIKQREPSKIITLNIIGSPQGLEVVSSTYADIDIYIAQIDEKLNSDKFIIPGLGDAGDRSYNTLKRS
ncbi:MAG: uracil phosphoribosyltransferase [Sulfurimonas sp. RIFOXYD12_FULL_33_39]|uniref:uracil phosphoribosyltransferase n=1 Tax=unclassified Sulfurimonas TaxID=2623549 RepID=UPI0008C81637|nr:MULTISPECIES: uracil phosphoribosyltransferase [unclassified Sulfurimonas]OHE07699.1 MAG: uracil phosphoribosyltransferase [Sulfurimonas sp. RIFCSPLOWO2_12_FULL_34_6]OHE10736.1 MAG: uracil phosphoribosyltransferase [Sulfurimonas sp. RIFOXYD12_FULL_33_39]OHE13494.1 MAG: uracil phosphoribosyltransferase [Sulfurimonas sp. RIFOXYD2_FULL_34_21]